jgi:hypothetical protein
VSVDCVNRGSPEIGNLPVVQSDHGYGVPFEALGGVYREQMQATARRGKKTEVRNRQIC